MEAESLFPEQETGNTERLSCTGAPQDPAQFQKHEKLKE